MTEPSPRPSRRAAERGFTLVEMMVSMTAGLIIAAAAFLLARNATTFFQAEAEITSAQFATMVGLTRLQSDLRRAGYLSTPNIQADPKRCGDPSTYPAGLAALQAITIVNGGSVSAHSADHALTTANGLNPDSIVIGGQFGSTEQYAIGALFDAGGGAWTVELQRNGPLIRAEQSAVNAANALTDVFKVGRFVRIVDMDGREAYGVIQGFDGSGTFPAIHLATSPALAVRDSNADVCGCAPPCVGGLINPIHRVRWDLRAVDPATYSHYAGMFEGGSHAASDKHAGEAPPQRTELVRVELDADGAEIDDTLEVVAEYAVDLKFGITVAVPGVTVPTVTRYPIGDANVYAKAAADADGGVPEHIRSVQVRLSTRAGRRDRDVGIAPPSQGGLYRFSLGTSQGYARMRTLITDVSLPNLASVPW